MAFTIYDATAPVFIRALTNLSKILEKAETKEITLKFPSGEMKFSGKDFATGFALPNFYFHVTTAYAILRSKGIQIGKMDFLGGV